MSDQEKERRSYRSEKRQAQARQTRQRILQAAQSLFEQHGFEHVTVDQLAAAAEVSAPTIYALFQSKRGVLKALMDGALPVEQFESLVIQGKLEPAPIKRMALTARLARQIYEAERSQIGLFQGAAVLTPELRELEREREERRYRRQEETVVRLAREGVLREGLTLERARDLFWAYTGRDLYRLLVIERGWSSDDYESWLAQQLVDTLLREP